MKCISEKHLRLKTLILGNQAILKNEYFISNNRFHFFLENLIDM